MIEKIPTSVQTLIAELCDGDKNLESREAITLEALEQATRE